MMITRDGDWAKMFNRRAVVLGGIQAGLISTLIGRMYYLQVVESDRYKVLAEGNRVNVQLLPPPRGRILDRFGHLLAGNTQQFRVLIVPEQTSKVSDTLAAIANLIELADYELDRIKKEVGRHRSFVPITVKENLSWEEMARIQVNAPDLPGVIIDEGLIRNYPYSDKAAHLLGYVSSVTESDLNGDPLLQLPGFRIGKSGVEKMADPVLRGKGGTNQVEVNAYGRVIRELERKEGEPGQDLVLTIDERIQKLAADRLGEESAAINVMDIYTGEMLAMASNPGFDPQVFSRAPTPQEWRELSTNPRAPLINKAIAGRYSPGSTFKLGVALAALEHGVISPEQTVFCSGSIALGARRWYCWKNHGHGTVDMVTAITRSCDCYFYELARRLGVDRIAAMAKKLGLGDMTDVGLPGEQKGLIPTEAWKKATRGEIWHPGETLNVGIGQGQVVVTPIQLVTYIARIANGGLAVKPTLLRPVTPSGAPRAPDTSGDENGPPEAAQHLESLGIAAQHLAIVHRGAFGVVNVPGGTATSSALRFADPEKREWAMAGKTGSTQIHQIKRAERDAGVRKQEQLPWEMRDHALFVGFAPFHAPRYAVSVIVEHGMHGGSAAAPIARDVMQLLLEVDPSRKQRVDEVAANATSDGPI
jgi:penicillin-binding protein 2